MKYFEDNLNFRSERLDQGAQRLGKSLGIFVGLGFLFAIIFEAHANISNSDTTYIEVFSLVALGLVATAVLPWAISFLVRCCFWIADGFFIKP
jgi:hypothetical protein